MLAPIILFVYNRENHTEATLEALRKNELAAQSELFIFSDGAKTEDELDKIRNVRSVLYKYQQGKDFKKIQIVEAKKNQGLAASVISGVTKVIEEYGKVIVLEDDIVTTPLFLSYMNKALDYYEKYDNIWSVSGYTMDLSSLRHYDKEVYFGYRASSWGWGTWKNRWETVDWEMKDYAEFAADRERCTMLNRGGEDMCEMLKLQMQGKIDSWAIRWCYHQSKRDMLTVFPVTSFLVNIGCDGSGIHSGVSTMFDAKLDTRMEIKEDFFSDPVLERKIIREFHDMFSGTFKVRIRNKLRGLRKKYFMAR